MLLLPHHGSVEPATGAFVGAVNPQHVIRSTSQRSGTKRSKLLSLLGDRSYFSTADVGAVTVTIRYADLQVCGYRQPPAGP